MWLKGSPPERARVRLVLADGVEQIAVHPPVVRAFGEQVAVDGLGQGDPRQGLQAQDGRVDEDGRAVQVVCQVARLLERIPGHCHLHGDRSEQVARVLIPKSTPTTVSQARLRRRAIASRGVHEQGWRHEDIAGSQRHVAPTTRWQGRHPTSRGRPSRTRRTSTGQVADKSRRRARSDELPRRRRYPVLITSHLWCSFVCVNSGRLRGLPFF